MVSVCQHHTTHPSLFVRFFGQIPVHKLYLYSIPLSFMFIFFLRLFSFHFIRLSFHSRLRTFMASRHHRLIACQRQCLIPAPSLDLPPPPPDHLLLLLQALLCVNICGDSKHPCLIPLGTFFNSGFSPSILTRIFRPRYTLSINLLSLQSSPMHPNQCMLQPSPISSINCHFIMHKTYTSWPFG